MRPSLPLRGEVDAYALMTWSAVRAVGGYDWDELERWLVEAEGATERTDLVIRGMILHRLAAVALRRGRPATATRRAQEAVEHLERADPFRELPLACSYVVMGAAMRRDTDAARAALEVYEAALGDTPVPPSMLRPEATARAMFLAAEGESSRAVATVLEAVEARAGYPLDEALLLHEAFRAGAPAQGVAPALDRAAANCDAPLPAALARLVAAAAARDSQGLTESADTLEEIGAWLWAAEAAALAAASFEHVGREDAARRARSLASRLLESCEDVWSPLLSDLGLARVELTRREREIIEGPVYGVESVAGLIDWRGHPEYLRTFTVDGVRPGVDAETGFDISPDQDLLVDPATGVRLEREESGELVPIDPFTGRPLERRRSTRSRTTRTSDGSSTRFPGSTTRSTMRLDASTDGSEIGGRASLRCAAWA